jgi:hypothetical protein
MAQTVSRRPGTSEARVRFRFSPCGICGEQSGTETGFFLSTSVLPCQFHSTGAQLHGKTKKKLIIFITGLHNKPQGCGASVASAAGPFTPRKKLHKCFVLNMSHLSLYVLGVKNINVNISVVAPFDADPLTVLTTCQPNHCCAFHYIKNRPVQRRVTGSCFYFLVIFYVKCEEIY